MRGKNKSTRRVVSPCHVGVDLLGSDIPPDELFQAILFYCKELNPSVNLTLLGHLHFLERLSLLLPTSFSMS